MYPSPSAPLSPTNTKKHQLDINGSDPTQPPAKHINVTIPGKLSAAKNSGKSNKPTKKTGLEDDIFLDQPFVEATAATKVSEPAKNLAESNPINALVERERLANEIPKEWSSTIQLAGKGLSNFTINLCYRHSLFQALFHIPQFVHWLKNYHKTEDCVSDADHGCTSCFLRTLAVSYWVKGLDQRHITIMLKKINKFFEDEGWDPNSLSGHGDPEEQMVWMMNQMSKEIPSDRFAYYHAFHQFKLQSEIRCKTCRHVSRTDGDFVDFLQVPIKPRVEGDNLDLLIENYLDETVTQYICDSCKGVADRRRIQKIAFAPDVLMITLKRFEMNNWGYVEKDHDRVIYDKTLDLSLHRADSTRGLLKYHLQAVICHQGSTDIGHYRCIAVTPTAGWVDFDDSHMSRSSLEEALNPALNQGHREAKWTPYLLFYQRDKNSLP